MKKKIASALIIAGMVDDIFAQMPVRTPENIEKYKRICREYIHREMKGMYREPGGALKFPFLAPGSNQYLDMYGIGTHG